MLRQFARLPLRRSLYSRAGSSPQSFARYARSFYTLGASVTIAGYLAWSWSSNTRHISLDSEPISVPKQPSISPEPAALRTFDTPTPTAPQNDTPESAAVSSGGSEPSPVPPDSSAEGEGAEGESSGGAFNPETGEINWDCPCLGGMAHGPCGPQFREAFSCFVHSDADPKGIDCVEKFKAMQDCFREHPDVYGDEIMADEDEELPADSATTDKKEGDPQPPDSVPPETTQPATPASS